MLVVSSIHVKHASQTTHSGALLLQQPHSCMVVLDNEHPQAVPTPHSTDHHPVVSHVLQENATIFKQDLEHTTITDQVHPIKVPTRSIPFHYVECVHQQLQEVCN